MELKAEAGRLERRVADVAKSREKWRDEAEELRRRVQKLEVQTAALREQTAAFKKTDLTEALDLDEEPSGVHGYAVGTQCLFLRLVLQGVSLRCAPRVLVIVSARLVCRCRFRTGLPVGCGCCGWATPC